MLETIETRKGATEIAKDAAIRKMIYREAQRYS